MSQNRLALLIFPLIFIGLAVPTVADPRDNAHTIVVTTMMRDALSASSAPLMPIMEQAMEAPLAQSGGTLRDADAFYALMAEEFITVMVEIMSQPVIALYLDRFSPLELADMAADRTNEPILENSSRSSPVIDYMAQMDEAATQQAMAETLPRVAARIRAEGLVILDDAEAQERLLDTLSP
ncbi:hypothetical protein [Roseobacter sp. HKCCA0434]|uniref:hypothetical protein n=1 Tax=Roseobacter sp. HKCCA0434 TaxID=3079297 RepID=UPI00290591E3|nr:hypothetical protein [Roseobacter sp. HKCCA0434]